MSSSLSRSNRRSDIDWLRVIAVLLLIPFHTARIFDIWEPFYAKNGESSAALSYGLIAFLNPWHMPLLFLLAGASTWFALGFRSSGQYTQERFTRLLVPLLFGVLVIVPPQGYYALLTQGTPTASFADFLMTYFMIDFSDLSGYFGKFTPGHLWFILFLFVFSLIGLPLFHFLKGDMGRGWIARLAAFAIRPGAIFLLAIPLALAEILPDVGGKNPFWYFAIFVLGFILMTDERFQESIDRQRGVALALGLVTMSIGIYLSTVGVRFERFSSADVALHFLGHFNTWFWLIALLGFGHRWLNFSNRFLRYAGEASYPFFILHQTAIVAVGYYVVQEDLGIAAKFSLICLLSLLGSLAGYELIKRFNLTRWLFGMKSLPAQPRLSLALLGGRRGKS
jgi:glucans biosynthesis protein C